MGDNWKEHWDCISLDDDMFAQMGRKSYGLLEYFVYINNTIDSLGGLKQEDIVLDAGCGAGWMSIAISPYVNRIIGFDYSDKMIGKAKENIALFQKINVYQDDLLIMDKISNLNIKFNKVIVGSALQYVENVENVSLIIEKIYAMLSCGGKIIFTHNPDIRKKADFIQSYNLLDWDQERIIKSIEAQEKKLWLHPLDIENIAKKIGFYKYYETPINKKLFQYTHMFDYVLEK